jgi:regulator of sigma E protease
MLGIIVLVVIIFSVLVVLHELGHFIVAKRNGIEVQEFGVGFPPKVWGVRRGGTLYSINLFPLGGFVRMKGESSADRSRGSFGGSSFTTKAKVLLAGVAANALIAYVVLVYLCLTGLPPVLPHQFSVGTPGYAQPKQVLALAVTPGSPAEQAGIVKGDLVLAAEGQALSSDQELVNFTKAHEGETVTLTIRHAGRDRNVSLQLRDSQAEGGRLGVLPFQTYRLRYSLPAAIVTAAGLAVQLMIGTVAAVGGLVAGLLTKARVSADVTGPVGIVMILKNLAWLGSAYVLLFITSISISLAVINALPFPALDGGRLALAVGQKLARKDLSARLETVVHLVGFGLLILLMIIVTVVDLRRL